MAMYTIKKGKHYTKSNRGFSLKLNRRKESKIVYFYPNCKYDLTQMYSPTSLNKVFGFSVGLNHHKNSIRVGWRYVKDAIDDRIELSLYTYQKKSRLVSHETISVRTEINYVMILERRYDRAILTVTEQKDNTKSSSIDIAFPTSPYMYLSYGLRPYFGGIDRAPHDVTIEIDKLK